MRAAPSVAATDRPRVALRPRPPAPSPEPGFVRLAADLHGVPAGPRELWFDVEEAAAPPAWPQVADAFALALLFPAMMGGWELRVEAPLSRRLVENIGWLNEAWPAWRPRLYRPMELRPAAMVEPAPVPGRRAVLLFSGGADSCHALLRHRRGLLGERSREVVRALLVHGADFAAGGPQAEAATARARRMTADLGVPLAVVRTNLRAFATDWEDSHGACLAACLHLFAAEAGCGVIGSTVSFPNLGTRWGSHPATDPLLSGGAFEVTYDALAAARVDKLALVATWPAALADLRVCYHQPEDPQAGNCGRCRKCLFTRLGLLACGARSAAFPGDPGVADLRHILPLPAWAGNELRPIRAAAVRHGRGGLPVFRALGLLLWLHTRRQRFADCFRR